ncbi:MAG: hypothetical protein K8S18_01675 [Desulfobacula sp.]|nr:hypothetical protein [Desulfobacula sp.]
MYFRVTPSQKGFSLSLTGPAWQADPCEFRFPEHIWNVFPAKQALINELAYICTLPTPLILKYPVVEYDTSKPRFIDFYHHCFDQAIPNLVEEIPSERADSLYHRFHSIQRKFHGDKIEGGFPARHGWNKKTIVLPLSYGKDSLLSLATLRELGYKVIPVYIDERVLPRGNFIKEKLKRKLKNQFDLYCHIVENELHLLCDYQVLEQPLTQLHRLHIYFVYLLAMIPFCYYYRAPVIIFNNEFHHNFLQLHKDEYLCPHRYMQSTDALKGYADLVQKFSGGQLTVANFIGVLDDFAIHRILHGRFPEFGSYQVSCHMEMNQYKRWCHNCYRCARAFIFFLAMGIDPFEMGFEVSMMPEDKKKLFVLFGSKIDIEDEYKRYVAAEEELAFLMALKRGASGPLMDLYRSKFQSGKTDIKKQEKKLKKKVFRLHCKAGSTSVEKKAAKLYKGYLKDM